jgi:bacterioferritin
MEAMKGNAKVIAALNEALQEELLAINQYFVHSEMCENWKYETLSKFIKKQSIDEMKHAEKLIERVLFLDGSPTVTGPTHLKIGKNVKEQIASDLELELGAVKLYNAAIKLSRDEGDNATAEFFAGLLKDEEDHADWLESQLHLMEEIGYERYLAKQVGKD